MRVTVALAFLIFLTSCFDTIDQKLMQWGFTRVGTVSSHWAPGQVIYFKDGSRQAGIVCEARDVLGASFLPHSAGNLNLEQKFIAAHGLKEKMPLPDNLQTIGGAEHIKDLTLELTHGEILEILASDIADHRRDIDPICLEMIKSRIAHGFKVTVISRALKSDAVLTVNWKRAGRPDPLVRRNVMASLAQKMALEVDAMTSDSMSGNTLYWGVQTNDAFLDMLLGGGAVSDTSERFD